MSSGGCGCLACTGAATVAVAVEHAALRQLIVALLSRAGSTWGVCPCRLADAADVAGANRADVAVVATADFPGCCRELLGVVHPDRVVVIGPEPEGAYERAARAAGAGAWVSRDRIAEDLPPAVRSVLGCTRGPDAAAFA